MKKYVVVILLVAFAGVVSAQETQRDIKSVDIKDINGANFNTSQILNDGPIVIDFWATWCKPCVKELMILDDYYIDWQEETGVKIYAVSIDDSQSMAKVAPFVNGKAWEYEILLDPNGDFKRAMGVINVPHTFVFDKDGNLMYQHSSFTEGDENKLHKIIVKVANGESIEETIDIIEQE